MSTVSPHVRPLDGLTVVSLEHAIAAPFCTRLRSYPVSSSKLSSATGLDAPSSFTPAL